MTGRTTRGEQAVVFYHQEYDGSLTRFMTIYRLTGTNREARANLGSRQLLLSTSSVAYAVGVCQRWLGLRPEHRPGPGQVQSHHHRMVHCG